MIAHDVTQVVLESSLRGGAALALAALVSLGLRRRSGAVRHAVWLAGLLALLAAPMAGALLPRLALPVLPAARAVSASSLPDASASPTVVESGSPTGSRAAPPRTDGLAIWTWIWAAGAAWMLARGIRAHAKVAGLARASEPITDPRLAEAWREALAGSGAPSSTQCRIVAGLEMPLACGLARPLVLLPSGAAAWDPATLRAVLAHELAHLRRRDPLLLAVAQVARALYWFHPLVWLAVRELRDESERACDDAVLRAGERPSRYAETLLAFAGGAAPEPAAALAFLRPRGLERRIAGVLAAHHDRRALAPGQRALIALAALAGAALMATVEPVPGRASRAETRATPRAEEGSADADAWLSRAPAAAPTSVRFRNRIAMPVRIRRAEVRVVSDAERPGSTGITMPELVLENRDPSRRVVAVKLSLELPTTRDRSWIEVPIPPSATTRLRMEPRQWSAVVPAGDEEELTIRVTGVRFEDGEGPRPGAGPDPAEAPSPPHGVGVPPGTPRPGVAPRALPPGVDGRRVRIEELPAPRAGSSGARPAPRPRPRPDDRGWIMARFRNPDDAPVVIVDARTAPREAIGDRPVTGLPEIVIENRSDRWVESLRIRYKADRESHAVSGYTVSIRPHGSVFLHREDYEMEGRPEDMTVQILGARFADGGVWGTLDSRIDARDRWVYPLSPEGR